MNPNNKTATEKYAESARLALVVTKKGIADLLTEGADPGRAERFIAAAASGLAARNVAYIPENFAAEAVRLGLAVDVLLATLEGLEGAAPADAPPAPRPLTPADVRAIVHETLEAALNSAPIAPAAKV